MKDYTRVIELFNFELHIQNYSNDWHTGLYKDEAGHSVWFILGYRLDLYARHYETNWGAN